jgi:hypothetical protein
LQESIGEWTRCYRGIPYNHDIKSSVPYHMNNSIDGYRSLIYRSEFITLLLIFCPYQDSRLLLNCKVFGA